MCKHYTFLLLLCSFMKHCHSKFNISPTEFDERWKCSSICSGINHLDRIRDYCVRIAPEYAHPPVDRQTIRDGSKCTTITIHFEENEYDLTPRLIGLCYLNPHVSKCISKGEAEAELIVYDYDPRAEVCYPRFIKDNFLVSTVDKNKNPNCCNIL